LALYRLIGTSIRGFATFRRFSQPELIRCPAVIKAITIGINFALFSMRSLTSIPRYPLEWPAPADA
jgi:hypothetical protein